MRLFTLFLSLLLSTAQAADPKPYHYTDRDLWQELPQIEVDTGSESLLFTQISNSNTKNLVLFLGEPAPANNGDALVLQALAKNANVWYLDPADALFMDRTRIAMRNYMGDFLPDLMDHLTKEFEQITLVTFDVMAVPVLRGLRTWQSQAQQKQRNQLQNVALLYPSLYINTPIAGQPRKLFPIAYQSALPITIFQPQLGAQANTINETAQALRQGGSLVQIEYIDEATDGIYKYQDIRLMAQRFSEKFSLMQQQMHSKRQKIGYQVFAQTPIDYSPPQSTIVSGLKQLPSPTQMQPIVLDSFEKQRVRVPEDYQGKALLVNFWATWCPHCVEEIPSMNRALDALGEENFAMISISYKDTDAIMAKFLEEVKVDFPILMDKKGEVSQAWKVFAFPSSFLIDKQGMIRYSINAGAIWDDPELLEVMHALSEE